MLNKTLKVGLNVKKAISEGIVPAMIEAPSAHNTQPWRFIAKNDHLDILPDWKRHLNVSDNTTRQTYVSLGCALANGLVASAQARLPVKLSYFPDGIGENKAAVRLEFRGDAYNQSLIPLADKINTRHADRSLYDAEPLTDEEKAILSTAKDDSVFLLQGQEALEKLAQVTEEATYSTLSRVEFREELSHWIRNNWTRQPDGMPGYAVGMPTPVSFVIPTIMKFAPIHKQEGPKSHRQIASSSAVAVIATPADTPIDWIHAGQLLETLWLEASLAGLGAMPIIASVESSPETRQKLQHVCQTKHYPQSVLRIGHSAVKELRASPRRTIEDCLEYQS